MSDPSPTNHESRLTRIEESLGFAQHDLDELSSQVRSLHAALAAMSKRIDRLERRMTETESGDDGSPTDSEDQAG